MRGSISTIFKRVWFSIWYYFRPPWDTGVSPPELLDFLKAKSSGRALDLGCGTGTNAITLAQHGWEVTGVDFALPAIRRGQARARRAGVEVDFRVADVTRLENLVPGFDLVLDIGCFHSLSEAGRQRYVRNLVELLAPSGTFLLYTMIKENSQADGPGIRERDLAGLARSLKLVARADGVNRGERPSAWLTFLKPEQG